MYHNLFDWRSLLSPVIGPSCTLEEENCCNRLILTFCLYLCLSSSVKSVPQSEEESVFHSVSSFNMSTYLFSDLSMRAFAWWFWKLLWYLKEIWQVLYAAIKERYLTLPFIKNIKFLCCLSAKPLNRYKVTNKTCRSNL